MDIISKLTNHIFSDCTEIELNYLIKFSHIKIFNKDDIIIKEGDSGTDIYVILDGNVDVILDLSSQLDMKNVTYFYCDTISGITGDFSNLIINSVYRLFRPAFGIT
jgi:hypothetical protein